MSSEEPKPNPTKFKPGQSGNPKGGPRRERAWAELIRKCGKQKVTLADGTEVMGQQLLAELTMQALLTGQIKFPRLKGDRTKGRVLVLAAKDWIRFLKETREHLEPPARQEIDLTTNGEKFEPGSVVVYLPENNRPSN